VTMAKLTGKAKAEFLARMEAGRAKARRNPRRGSRRATAASRRSIVYRHGEKRRKGQVAAAWQRELKQGRAVPRKMRRNAAKSSRVGSAVLDKVTGAVAAKIPVLALLNPASRRRAKVLATKRLVRAGMGAHKSKALRWYVEGRKRKIGGRTYLTKRNPAGASGKAKRTAKRLTVSGKLKRNPLSKEAKRFQLQRKAMRRIESKHGVTGLSQKHFEAAHRAAAAYRRASGKKRRRGSKVWGTGPGLVPLSNPLSRSAKAYRAAVKRRSAAWEKHMSSPGKTKGYIAAIERAEKAARTHYKRKGAKGRAQGIRALTRTGLRNPRRPHQHQRTKKITGLLRPVSRGGFSTSAASSREFQSQIRRFKRRYSAESKQRRRNASTPDLFAAFQGRKARTKTTLRAPNGTPSTTYRLGRLRKLKYANGSIAFPSGSKTPYLAADTRGKLHVVGGQYRVNSAPQCFGKLHCVEYETRKPHLGAPSETIFVHKFGEEGGKRPDLHVDNEGMLKIRGGSYRISPDGIID
jgi:hypothetical protein